MLAYLLSVVVVMLVVDVAKGDALLNLQTLYYRLLTFSCCCCRCRTGGGSG